MLNAQICVPSSNPIDLDQLSLCAHQPSAKAHSWHPWGCTYGASHRILILCGWLAWGIIGVCGPARENCSQGVNSSSWAGFLRGSSKWFVGSAPLWWPLRVLAAAVLPACLCPSHAVHFSILDGARKKWISLPVSLTTWEVRCLLIHSYFLSWGNCRQRRFLLALSCATLWSGWHW